MAELTIWQGSVKTIRLQGSQSQPDTDMPTGENAGQIKFDTCKYRGKTEEDRKKSTCCSTITVRGYACVKLGIHPLTPERCKECLHYIKK